jgi:hypothetical protein
MRKWNFIQYPIECINIKNICNFKKNNTYSITYWLWNRKSTYRNRVSTNPRNSNPCKSRTYCIASHFCHSWSYKGCLESNTPCFFGSKYLLKNLRSNTCSSEKVCFKPYFSKKSPPTSTALRQWQMRVCPVGTIPCPAPIRLWFKMIVPGFIYCNIPG